MKTDDNEFYSEVTEIDKSTNKNVIWYNLNNHKHVDKIWEVYLNSEKDRCTDIDKYNHKRNYCRLQTI